LAATVVNSCTQAAYLPRDLYTNGHSYESAARPPSGGSASAADPSELSRLKLHCTACDYGAVAAVPPERCPICGGEVWEFDPWRPFTSLIDDLAPSQHAR
jgi:hypothetical protein